MLIASRRLKVRHDGQDRDIEVRIFLPEQHGEKSWSCRYEIDWPHGQWSHAAWGVDSVQALNLTMRRIGTSIYVSEYHEAGRLWHEAPGRGYDFPVPNNLRHALIGDDKDFL